MKQLSGTDAMFLQLERGNNFMHVASLAIYDPSTAPGGGVRFKDVLRFFASRVAEFPQFRRRLVTLPLSLDRPYWFESSNLDVEFHVRHIALPHPGDWRQLCIQVARLHSRPLDRSKPLWEAYVIEGLHNVEGVPPGSFALYTKLHHSFVDGESGTELLKALHTLTPEAIDTTIEEQDDAKVFHADREPTLTELYSRALAHNLQNLPTLARFSFDTTKHLAGMGAQALSRLRAVNERGLLETAKSLLAGDLNTLLPRMPPATRFSGKVSAHRVFTTAELPMADFKQIRRAVPEATINDQFLCVVGGAVRMYLSDKKELPEATLLAMVPVTLRGSDKGGEGNQVGMTVMPVHTEIEEPMERLRAICRDSQSAKALNDAIGKELMRDLLQYLPSVIANPVLRNVKLPGLSLIVSNVRGPDVPLYMAGARLMKYEPVSIAIDGMGLNITGFSYDGTLRICAISCREMLPDPAFFAECLRTAFAQMKAAAAAEGASEASHANVVAASRKRPARKKAPVSRSAKKAARDAGTGKAAGGRRKVEQPRIRLNGKLQRTADG